MSKSEHLLIFDQDNCPLNLREHIRFPPAGDAKTSGYNVLHFNPTNRPYRNNPSARSFVVDTLRKQQPPPAEVESDCAALMFAVELARKLNPKHEQGDHPGIFLELGFCSGRSLNFIAALGYDKQVFGFDSGEGLPLDWRPGFGKGTFAFTKNIHGAPFDPSASPYVPPFIPFVPLKNVRLVIGQLADVLPVFCTRFLGEGNRVELLFIDTDLYQSAADAYANLGPYIRPGRTVVVLDEGYNFYQTEDAERNEEWREHEFRATKEFAKAHNYRVRYHAFNTTHQQIVLTFEQRTDAAGNQLSMA